VTHSAPARPEVYRIMKRLFAPAESGEVPAVFALLDAARDERILPMIRRSRLDYCCLFLGALAPVLAEAAPYLVDISPRAPFTREILELGWGESWGIFVRAQQVIRPARLGYIWIGAKDSEHSTRDGVRQGLRDLSYVDGRDYVLEERYADSVPERLAGIIAELQQLRVALFLSPGVQVTRELIAHTSTIPIIATTPDLLASGFVSSLTRPGGNVTGMSLTVTE